MRLVPVLLCVAGVLGSCGDDAEDAMSKPTPTITSSAGSDTSGPATSSSDSLPGSRASGVEPPPSASETTEQTKSAPGADGGQGGEASRTTTTMTERQTTTAPPETDLPAEEPDASIVISSFSFQPVILDVSVGALVEVTNDDAAPHTWTADDSSWGSGTLGEGASFRHTFQTSGTYTYLCAIHPSMRGTVNVDG